MLAAAAERQRWMCWAECSSGDMQKLSKSSSMARGERENAQVETGLLAADEHDAAGINNVGDVNLRM